MGDSTEEVKGVVVVAAVVAVQWTALEVLLVEALYLVKMLYSTRSVDLRSRLTTSATNKLNDTLLITNTQQYINRRRKKQ